MQELYFQDKTFSRDDSLKKGEYDNCTFNGSDVVGKDLSGFSFTDCSFNGCDLSMMKLDNTSFRDVQFIDCKMSGIQFDACNPFGLSFSFSGCQLNYSSFFKMNIKKTVFKACQLREADFSECDLTSAVFDNCDLSQAIFLRTILEKTDFRTSCNYSMDPERNRLKKRNSPFQTYQVFWINMILTYRHEQGRGRKLEKSGFLPT